MYGLIPCEVEIVKIAFYKGTGTGLSGLEDRAIRWWTSGGYSHAELAFSDGKTGLASASTKGVAISERAYNDAEWDLVEIVGDETAARAWFEANVGKPYDYLGDFGFVWRPVRGKDGAYFCSEAVAAAMGWNDPWRYDPNTLAAAVSRITVPASDAVVSTGPAATTDVAPANAESLDAATTDQ